MSLLSPPDRIPERRMSLPRQDPRPTPSNRFATRPGVDPGDRLNLASGCAQGRLTRPSDLPETGLSLYTPHMNPSSGPGVQSLRLFGRQVAVQRSRFGRGFPGEKTTQGSPAGLSQYQTGDTIPLVSPAGAGEPKQSGRGAAPRPSVDQNQAAKTHRCPGSEGEVSKKKCPAARATPRMFKKGARP